MMTTSFFSEHTYTYIQQTIEVTDLQKSFECFEPVVLALREKMLPDNLIGQPNSTT